jgi:mono/diheme cytochrome c family protein
MRTASLLALFLFAAPAMAQDAAVIAEGKRLSEINCAKCHNIEAEGESPLTDAPPFHEVAKNYDVDELTDSFMEGLAVRHPLMPDWEVTEPQAAALAAFVMSLAPTGDSKAGDSAILLGHDLLRVNCARCHAIDAGSASPEPKAPPFDAIVKKYEPSALEEALAEGIVTGHENMPQFVFEPDQIAAIVGYLDTLKTP